MVCSAKLGITVYEEIQSLNAFLKIFSFNTQQS
jgi:hypothetical protein